MESINEPSRTQVEVRAPHVVPVSPNLTWPTRSTRARRGIEAINHNRPSITRQDTHIHIQTHIRTKYKQNTSSSPVLISHLPTVLVMVSLHHTFVVCGVPLISLSPPPHCHRLLLFPISYLVFRGPHSGNDRDGFSCFCCLFFF